MAFHLPFDLPVPVHIEGQAQLFSGAHTVPLTVSGRMAELSDIYVVEGEDRFGCMDATVEARFEELAACARSALTPSEDTRHVTVTDGPVFETHDTLADTRHFYFSVDLAVCLQPDEDERNALNDVRQQIKNALSALSYCDEPEFDIHSEDDEEILGRPAVDDHEVERLLEHAAQYAPASSRLLAGSQHMRYYEG